MKDRHGIGSAALFRLKRRVRQLQRGVQNALDPPPRLRTGGLTGVIAFESRTSLRGVEDPAEGLLTLGKIQNLRQVTRALNGLMIPPDQTFSFWRNVGRLTSVRGYVPGREIREGCVIPNIGGGVCQLTNALYQGALHVGAETVERHAHTLALPGSAAESGQDATVAWNDIDLRFRSAVQIQLECHLTSEELVVRFRAASPIGVPPAIRPRTPLAVVNAGSCVTCNEAGCRRHAPHLRLEAPLPPTYLLDASWPEWKAYAASDAGRLIVPRRGAWGSNAETLPLTAYRRSLRARWHRNRPPADVRAAQIVSDAQVARAMGHRLTYRDDELVIAQNLAPELWASGALAGRRFRIALTRPPLYMIHTMLDDAARREPEASSLTDFRATEGEIERELAALSAAQGLITPHAGLAARLAYPTELIPWTEPARITGGRQPERFIVFPGPAIARNGSQVVREAARALDLPVMILGRLLEPEALWGDIRRVEVPDWESRALAVVQPSVFETRPTALLRARAAGVPVVATAMCGLSEGEYYRIEFGDSEAMVAALARELGRVRGTGG